ncbi:Arginyl-tRNA--protein transferase 1 [Cladobotryum mycophilum]|uniref:arginyltransferase n=1 Tax=Cladobotryum mycophilum TaxID=491253 RepID=A0ABR0T024_9HYPO
MEPEEMRSLETEEATASDEYELLSPIGFSYYTNATSMTTQFYQTLLDRSWRRSGKLLYRPNQRKSCCPHYTIRLDSTQFRPSRDQRQAVNRFNKHITGDSYLKQAARLYPRSREETKKRDNEFNLTERIHEAEYDKLKTPPEPAHKLIVTLEEDNFTEEKYLVYNNYQQVVHGDGPEDRTRRSFERFLCSSPLKREVMLSPDGRQRRLGSYHQCYRLDGQLVAIGVLDLLPECVSSVYFLYHESIHKFAPGKLGALHEISLAMEDGYRWWYPGFYIHSCPKMRYKIDYMPQYILDPDNLSWYPVDQSILSVLDRRPYVSLGTALSESAPSKPQQDTMDYALTPAADANTTNLLGDSENDRDMDTDGSVDEDEDENQDENENGHGSLFYSRMPGIPSLYEMEKVNMDRISLKIFASGPLFETSDLVNWKTSRVSDLSGIKHSVAELVAALGPDLKELICLDLVRHRRA